MKCLSSSAHSARVDSPNVPLSGRRVGCEIRNTGGQLPTVGGRSPELRMVRDVRVARGLRYEVRADCPPRWPSRRRAGLLDGRGASCASCGTPGRWYRFCRERGHAAEPGAPPALPLASVSTKLQRTPEPPTSQHDIGPSRQSSMLRSEQDPISGGQRQGGGRPCVRILIGLSSLVPLSGVAGYCCLSRRPAGSPVSQMVAEPKQIIAPHQERRWTVARGHASAREA